MDYDNAFCCGTNMDQGFIRNNTPSAINNRCKIFTLHLLKIFSDFI